MASSRSRAITDPDPASGAGTIRGEAAGVVFERTGGPGAGPPLLLVHGLGASLRIWDPQVARLARERDVIAVDMPGFGDSPLLTGGESPTPWALAAALARLCDELGIERPHVAGNSLGGWVAIEMAKRDEVSTLCLISPAGLWRRPLGPRARDTRGVAKRLKPLVGPLVRSRRGREALLRTTAARPALIPPGEARELITTWIDAPGYDAANAEMRAHICTDLDRVAVPTTIAWGEHDRLLSPARPERRPPGSRFLILDECGHTPNWDEPELIAELLLEASAAGVVA
ncbi:MAG: alpha/beta fold hydrolase [Solirubrobacterales bacterium]|nr:alpha/beta fold hydrolase [Solirubrobacterales bacterium]MCB8971468.1 alpha/beta fold hydrolase [Thermoleophilales bacterium]MCO5327119.1 alpha/beta fold hydrolase [Solirubrobacterales bacterium]